MTQLNPYLHFSGNCREAMTFYRDCLGGDLKLMTIGESPLAGQMAPDAQNDVLHAHLCNGDRTLLGSDMRKTEQLASDGAVSLLINCADEAELGDLFAKLSAGGAVTCPVGPQFWGATFGSLTDKFGINWLLEYSHDAA